MFVLLCRHWYDNPLPTFALRVTEPGAQKVVGPDAVIAAGGDELTVTEIEFDVALPHEFVTTQS
jgi:hypothetical protein